MAKKCPSCGKSMNSHETFWDCDNCGEFIVKKGYETKQERGKQIPFGCSACGVKYSQERSTSMSFKLVNCTHRHCVFTIDEELRHFFLEDRSLLNCLFQTVRSVILRMFHKMNKSKSFVSGFICVLHTFGRPLEWNPIFIMTSK